MNNSLFAFYSQHKSANINLPLSLLQYSRNIDNIEKQQIRMLYTAISQQC